MLARSVTVEASAAAAGTKSRSKAAKQSAVGDEGETKTVAPQVSHGHKRKHHEVEDAKKIPDADDGGAGAAHKLLSGLKRVFSKRTDAPRANAKAAEAVEAGTAKLTAPPAPFSDSPMHFVYIHDRKTASSRTEQASKRSRVVLNTDGSLRLHTDQTFELEGKSGWSSIVDSGWYWVQPIRSGGFHVLCLLKESKHVEKQLDGTETSRGERQLENFMFELRVADGLESCSATDDTGGLVTLRRVVS